MFSIKFLVSNFNSGIRNRCSYVKVKRTVLIMKILKILLRDGYIANYHVMSNHIIVYLKYLNYRKGVVNRMILGSNKTGVSYKNILRKYRGRYILISSNKGILTREEAIENKVGGFVFLWVF